MDERVSVDEDKEYVREVRVTVAAKVEECRSFEEGTRMRELLSDSEGEYPFKDLKDEDALFGRLTKSNSSYSSHSALFLTQLSSTFPLVEASTNQQSADAQSIERSVALGKESFKMPAFDGYWEGNLEGSRARINDVHEMIDAYPVSSAFEANPLSSQDGSHSASKGLLNRSSKGIHFDIEQDALIACDESMVAKSTRRTPTPKESTHDSHLACSNLPFSIDHGQLDQYKFPPEHLERNHQSAAVLTEKQLDTKKTECLAEKTEFAPKNSAHLVGSVAEDEQLIREDLRQTAHLQKIRKNSSTDEHFVMELSKRTITTEPAPEMAEDGSHAREELDVRVAKRSSYGMELSQNLSTSGSSPAAVLTERTPASDLAANREMLPLVYPGAEVIQEKASNEKSFKERAEPNQLTKEELDHIAYVLKVAEESSFGTPALKRVSTFDLREVVGNAHLPIDDVINRVQTVRRSLNGEENSELLPVADPNSTSNRTLSSEGTHFFGWASVGVDDNAFKHSKADFKGNKILPLAEVSSSEQLTEKELEQLSYKELHHSLNIKESANQSTSKITTQQKPSELDHKGKRAFEESSAEADKATHLTQKEPHHIAYIPLAEEFSVAVPGLLEVSLPEKPEGKTDVKPKAVDDAAAELSPEITMASQLTQKELDHIAYVQKLAEESF
ncbi:unnamed protein product, partial [Strongylus vulgaris]